MCFMQGVSVDREDHQKEHTPYASNYSEALSVVVLEGCWSMNFERYCLTNHVMHIDTLILFLFVIHRP